jgi:2-keto-4-pentenoate hydratase
MLDSTQRTTAAGLLWAAERDLAPVDPLTETFPGIDVVDAYEIQLINIRRKIAAGARVRGHKVGLSSPVMQQMMGVDEPDYGHLLGSMVLAEDTPVPAAGYCYPGPRSRSATCSGPPCPARAAPRPTCWPRPSTSCRAWS